MEIKTIKPEELQSLRSLQNSYSDITAKFGQIKVEKLLLNSQLQKLAQLEESLETEYVSIQTKETEFLKSLETAYGKVNINLESGEIIPQ